MRANSLTDQALATQLGVSRPYITRIRGGVRQPSLPLAAKLSAATKLPMDCFLQQTGLAA
jgi:transcriptional regulator with XRE-family HTH domain